MTPDKRALKNATVAMLEGVGGVDKAMRYCRVSKAQLYDYGNCNRPDRYIPLDVIADLEPLARDREGSPHIVQLLCQMMGGVFVPVPDVPVTTGRLLELMSQLSGEFNDVTRVICNGLSDGNFCATDATQLEAQLDDVIRVSVGMRALARSIKGGEQ